MEQYELTLALDGAELHISTNAPAMNALVFEKLVAEYNSVQKTYRSFKPSLPSPCIARINLSVANFY